MLNPQVNHFDSISLTSEDMFLGIHMGNQFCQVVPYFVDTGLADPDSFLEIPSIIHQDKNNAHLYFGSSPKTGDLTYHAILRAFAFPSDPNLTLANLCREQLSALDMTPKDLLPILFEELIRQSEKKWSRRVKGAVVCIPDYFSSEQTTEFKSIAEKAGLNQVHLLPQDRSSLLAYANMHNELERSQPVLLYQLSDTHCTVSIAKIDKREVEILGRAVNVRIGGRFLTQSLLHYWEDINDKPPGYFFRHPELFVAAKMAAYKAQEQICNSFLFKKILDGPINAQISLEKYHELAEPMVMKSIRFTRASIENIGLNPGDIGDVIITGGASHLPLVHISLSRVFENAKLHLMPGYPLVARGAAVNVSKMLGEVSR